MMKRFYTYFSDKKYTNIHFPHSDDLVKYRSDINKSGYNNLIRTKAGSS